MTWKNTVLTLSFFPELWNTGYDLERLDFLRCRSEQSMKFLRQQARDRHIMIVGGSIPEKKRWRFL